MGYSSSNTLGAKARLSDVLALISSLGFVPGPAETLKEPSPRRHYPYFWFDAVDYKSITGVQLSVYAVRGPRPHIKVDTNTRVGRSYWDLVKQNEVIRLLRRLFGGSFRTDEGRNRLWEVEGPPPEPVQAGCEEAYSRFRSNTRVLGTYRMLRAYKGPTRPEPSGLWYADVFNPTIAGNNFVLPFLVACMEDYFKSTYIALLRSSDKRADVLRSGKYHGPNLVRIADGTMTVEEALVESMPFQKPSAFLPEFRKIDKRLDFYGVLVRPNKRRKTTLLESLETLVEMRHALVHRAEVHPNLGDRMLERMVADLEAVVERCFLHVNDVHGWGPVAIGGRRRGRLL